MEFLIGRSLANNITNLMLSPLVDAAARDKGLRLAELLEQEPDAGLGNGGLGRLAACFIDSLATLADPGHRLRPPLRLRDLPPGDPRRLPGRTPRPLAGPARPVGGRRGRTRRCPSRSARRFEVHGGQIIGASRAAVAPARGALRPAGGRLRRADDQHPPPVAGRDPGRLRLRRVQRRRLLRRGVGPGARRDRSAASCTRTTRRPAAGRCGSSRSTSSSPARWPTSSPGSAAAATTGRRCRTRSPSSSTTPTRRWPWPS